MPPILLPWLLDVNRFRRFCVEMNVLALVEEFIRAHLLGITVATCDLCALEEGVDLQFQ